MRFETSDHRPIHSVFDTSWKKAGKLFRFDRRLTDNEEVKELVFSAWNSQRSASVSQRIAYIWRAIARWSKSQHLNSRKNIEQLRAAIYAAMASPSTEDTIITALNSDLLKAYKAEENFWKQRNRTLWLALGDRNTGFFHAASKERRARNRMNVLENAEGVALYEEQQIAAEITRYFDEIFTTRDSGVTNIVPRALESKISEEARHDLTRLPTIAEIRKALFSIRPDKAQDRTGSRSVSSRQIRAQ